MFQGKYDDVLDNLVPGFWREGFVGTVVGKSGIESSASAKSLSTVIEDAEGTTEIDYGIFKGTLLKLNETDGIVFIIGYTDTDILVSGVWEALEVCGNGVQRSYSHFL